MADRRGGNQSRLCLGACRCLGENEADRQASQKSKTLEQSKKRPHAIIIRGTHDDRTHSGQVLQNAPDAAGSIAAPVSGARHRQRAYTVGEPLRRDIADWGMSWTRPRTASNVDETACGARRSLQSVQEGRSIGDVMAVRPSAPASMSYSRRPYRQRVALLLRTTRAKAGRRLR